MAASSSQDPLFEVALRALPEVLGAAAGLADLAILESYPCESYKELVDAGVTDDGTRQYSGIGITDTIIDGTDVGSRSLSFPFICLSSYRFSFVSLLLLFSLSSSLLQTRTNREV